MISTLIDTKVAFADLKDGLVAYYPFNGNANDESVNGNHGTVYGATLTTDRFGNTNKAYSFDGVDDYIDSKFNFNGGSTNFTISYWAKFYSLSGKIFHFQELLIDLACPIWAFNLISEAIYNLMKTSFKVLQVIVLTIFWVS